MYYVIEDIEGIQVLEFDENWPILDVESVLSGPFLDVDEADEKCFLHQLAGTQNTVKGE